MPIVYFRGTVLPAHGGVDVTIRDLPTAHWEEASIGLIMDFSVHIQNSRVTVECNVNRYEDCDLPHLHMRAFDLARAAIDILCFKNGWGLTAWIDIFVKPDGTEQRLFANVPELAPLCTSYTLAPGENLDIWAIIAGEPPLYMALNDLIMAITMPHYAPVNCGRAVDGIRHMMTPQGTDRKQGWPLMRQNLNVDRSYLSFITDQSTGPRHGDRTFIAGAEVNKTVERSWIVMNRFLEFRKRGNQPLLLADFPLLIG